MTLLLDLGNKLIENSLIAYRLRHTRHIYIYSTSMLHPQTKIWAAQLVHESQIIKAYLIYVLICDRMKNGPRYLI
jgi:hypothetical protein